MQIAVFIITLLAIGAIEALIWQRRRIVAAIRGDRKGVEQESAKTRLTRALRMLNCKVSWSRNGDDLVGRFDYQSGHFNLLLEKNESIARLSYFEFYEADLADIDGVRMLCNLCNLNTTAGRVTYTVDEKEGKVQVHIFAPVLTEGVTSEQLAVVMAEIFRWHSIFVGKMEEAKDKAKENEPVADVEKNHAEYVHELALIREQEMMHQSGGDTHELPSDPATLRTLVASALGLNDIAPVRLMLTADGETKTIDDADAILQFPFHEALIAGGAFAHHSAVALLDFYDEADPVSLRHLTIDFEQEGATAHTLYYRATLSLSPLSRSRGVGENAPQRRQLTSSVLMGYDLLPTDELRAKFRYLWKEAVAKRNNGDGETMTADEKLLADMQDSHMAACFAKGQSLYEQGRYYEALMPLLQLHGDLSRQTEQGNRKVMTPLMTVSYYVGCCFMALRQYDRAAYYLQQTLPTSQVQNSEAYINCLVNGGDFRALSVLNGLQDELQRLLDNDDEETPVDRGRIEPFLAFIKRRKAYVLVSLGRYHEAEPLLKQLLDDPDSSDFALGELAYIHKRSGESKKTTL